MEAVKTAAETVGCEPVDLFVDKPKQARKWATLARMVHQKGERHQLQIDSLHRLARAAGIALEDVYEADELAEARAHEGERVSIRIRAYDLVADLPKSDSILWALLAERHEKEFRALVHQAKREAFTELERWIGYGLAGEDGELHSIATGGLIGWSLEHQSARPVDDTPGDPHLHVHIMIVNMARWTTADGGPSPTAAWTCTGTPRPSMPCDRFGQDEPDGGLPDRLGRNRPDVCRSLPVGSCRTKPVRGVRHPLPHRRRLAAAHS
ncbi:relaxase domain-containing protein [Streptomyces sp. NPDC057236]|uniref:relaxase domain-containing protein n=1 Tax=Streptomyces sp. NPDC057236 TaxID=3346059 RepID=UPI003626A28A